MHGGDARRQDRGATVGHAVILAADSSRERRAFRAAQFSRPPSGWHASLVAFWRSCDEFRDREHQHAATKLREHPILQDGTEAQNRRTDDERWPAEQPLQQWLFWLAATHAVILMAVS